MTTRAASGLSGMLTRHRTRRPAPPSSTASVARSQHGMIICADRDTNHRQPSFFGNVGRPYFQGEKYPQPSGRALSMEATVLAGLTINNADVV